MKKALLLLLFIGLIATTGCTVRTAPTEAVVVEPAPVIIQPRIIFIPDYDVFIVDDPDVIIFFYHDYWYWFNGRVWHRSVYSRGPWVIIRDEPPFRIPPGHIIKRKIKFAPPAERILEDRRFKVEERKEMEKEKREKTIEKERKDRKKNNRDKDR